MIYAYNNLFDSATITASSEATGFPATNVQHPFRTKVWQTDGATAGTANLVIDHGTATAVTCIILANYNWSSAPGTLDLEFNATDAWGAPSETEALTWAATPATTGNNSVIIKTFTSHSYRYNRLNVVYSPGATPTDWDLGRIFIGTYFEPDSNPLSNTNPGSLIDPSIKTYATDGQLHADELTKFRRENATFFVKSQAQWDLWQTMFNHSGTHKDLFVAIDYDNEPNEQTMYCQFTKIPGMSRISAGSKKYFRINTSIEELR